MRLWSCQMKQTNFHNLPEVVVKACGVSYPPKAGRLSVTDLINPPRIRILKMRHWEELVEDISERLWSIPATAIHVVLDKAKLEDALQEEKLVVVFNGVEIVGKPDIYHNGEIADWKITSVYSFLLGQKHEWVAQENIYKWLYEKLGFKVDKLTIHAFLRDWRKHQRDPNYPPIPFQSIDIPIWNDTERYIRERIELHNEAEKTLPECNEKERWYRGEEYAIMKKGRKSAVRVFLTREMAEKYIRENALSDNNHHIERREGINIRCEDYCPVREVCHV